MAVIGGGLIGLATAWRLARRGIEVTVFERDLTARGASWVAAGMLAPVSEFGFENEDFLALGQRSLARYSSFLEELAGDSGVEVPIDHRGTLVVGFNRDDIERIRRIYTFREHRELPVQWLTGSEARDLEPLLSPRTSAAMWIPEDHQVNNRALVDAIKAAFVSSGGTLRERDPVDEIRCERNRFVGVTTASGDHEFGACVLSAGCWSGQIPGLPEPLVPKVRPVKGQIVGLAADSSYEFSRVIRAPDAYILPKNDGRILVGATEEEMGFDTAATAGPVMRLIERAWEAVPSIYDLRIESIDVGLRPGTRDHEPLIGESGVDGLAIATGHYRHGILLAPVTADAVCGALTGEGWPDWIVPFSPSRFRQVVEK